MKNLSGKNLVLIGMPGCGKTVIGEMLSKILSRKFVDIDEYIEKTVNKTISQIFKNGEQCFRDIETKVVSEISRREKLVISTGGGVIKNLDNIKNLSQNGIIIFIDRPVDNIAADVDIQKRPLLKDGAEKLYELFEKRYELYKKYCDFKIDNDTTPEGTVQKILQLFSN
ncbi:shikimate kinase [Clostridium fermenticellae]|uniref:Shikimate kinase n=1 Tax=Clostridium fermenticellae TaxID=2068654 RepID=A0A386H404_9CLOT|nr:shikimate kinase [Clostridium fermenticellae]AYD40447.1 shikimate kinase [Clostridium fermenticellae]